MKQYLLVISFVFFISTIVFSQTTHLPYTPSNKSKVNSIPYRNIEFSLGYIPKPDVNSIKGNISINNIVFKRLGAYTSLEKEINSNGLTNTIGVTVSLNRILYVWGGMDILSKNGLFQSQSFSGPRKEVGIGVKPYKNTVVRIGWSSSVGVSISAGIDIPF